MAKKLTPGMAAAVCYADVFDYPLTYGQIGQFSLSSKLFTHKKFNSSNYFTNREGFYFLKGRGHLLRRRKDRERYSRKKLQTAKEVSHYLRFIPTIQMVAVTGALAMENCDRDDDIDLLIISKRGTVWTSRFFAVVLLELLGTRRRPGDKNSANKICMNMFLDEDHIQVPKNEQDIFAAHEVAQVKILWSRGEAEQRFWFENKWIKKFLPNVRNQGSRVKESKKINRYIPWTLNFDPLTIGEYIFKQIQLWYMSSKRTTEIVSEGYLRFHPNDARSWIIPEYRKRLAIVGLE